jgi:hypothetical protein
VLRFFARAADQPAVHPVPFCFAHGAAEPSEHPIIILSRIIDPLFIDHQGVSQGPDLKQPIPVTAGASQARRFSTPHRSGSPQADCGDARLTALSPSARGARTTLVLVHDDDQRLRPSQSVGALSALILAGRTRRILTDLHEG